MYTEESLDQLRNKIDIVEVLSEYLRLKRSGSTYKACCPFHEEKTPSFIVNPANGTYHCFGCSAHGDAMNFLMQHQGLSFTEAVLTLAKKFRVELVLQRNSLAIPSGVKERLYRANREAEAFFRYCLLFLPEGREAWEYLYQRGFSPNTVEQFHLGYAPDQDKFIQAMAQKNISENQLEEAGLLLNGWFLFAKRIIFPIQDSLGHTIGFSSRKFVENQRGAKYVNTPETLLFKKSRVLFGFNFSRRRIAKEKRVILVEGQIDCLQMIDAGFNCTLASQGTAFTEEHVKELSKLGVARAYLLFDGDMAGARAALKVGDLCQAAGISVTVCQLPDGHDPDSFLMQKGALALIEILDQGEEYLSFLVSEKMKEYPTLSPRERAKIIEEVVPQIKKWESTNAFSHVVVYEYLRQLASLMKVPESMVLVKSEDRLKPVFYAPVKTTPVHPELVIETDVLRCLLFSKQLRLLRTAQRYLSEADFTNTHCRSLYAFLIARGGGHSLEQAMEKVKDPLILDMLIHRHLNLEAVEFIFVQSLQKMLDHQWNRKHCPSLYAAGKDDAIMLKHYVEAREQRVVVSLAED